MKPIKRVQRDSPLHIFYGFFYLLQSIQHYPTLEDRASTMEANALQIGSELVTW